MKKIFVFLFLMILSLGIVTANGIGSIDDECQDFGFDYGVAKWQCEEEGLAVASSVYWWLEEGDPDTSVTGTCNVANWDVDGSDATGIVVKGGNIGAGGYHYSIIGSSGTVEESNPAMSHITFCGDDGEIPEFGIIASIAVLGLAGLFIYKKRK